MNRLKIKRIIPYILIIAFVCLVLSYQIYHKCFLSGMDYYFHMSRTYEAAMQIKTGHFSYFLSLFSWRQNARIVNAMYGPLGGYFSGLLLLVTGSWLRWEIAFNFIVILIAGVGMHQLNRYWHVDSVIDILITFLYMVSPAVFNFFVFFQSFFSVGAAFIPWVFLAGSRIADGHFSAVKLMAIMIVITELHLVTLMLSVIVIASFTVPALLTRSNRRSIFKKLLISTGLTLILTFNVWGALLGVMMSNRDHILLTYPHILPMSSNPFNTVTDTYPQTSFWQSPSLIGPLVFIIFVTALILWGYHIRQTTLALNVTVILSVIFLWLSSKYFPWTFLQRRVPIVETIVQFPGRFLAVGLVATYLTFGKLVSGHHKFMIIPAVILLVLAVCNLQLANYRTFTGRGRTFYSHNVIDWRGMKWNRPYSSSAMRRSLISGNIGQFVNHLEKPVADYLPTSMRYTDKDPKEYIRIHPYGNVASQLLYHPTRTFNYKVRLQHRAEENVTVNSAKRQIVRLPFVRYRHTRVMLNGRDINPKISKVGAIWVRLKHGTNHVTLYYQPSLKYRVGLSVSLITWVLILIFALIRRFRFRD